MGNSSVTAQRDALAWSIAEPFNFAWEREYLYLDLPEGVNGEAITAVTDGARMLPAQYDPARRALVVCLDVAPGQHVTLTPCQAEPVEPGVTVDEQAGVYLLRNAQCAAKLAATAQVTDAGDRWVVTGPIVGVIGPDGRQRCGSRLVINKSRFFPHDRASIARIDLAKIAAEETPPTIEITLETRGPIFARYHYALTMSDGARYAFTATMMADHPILYVAEETNLQRDAHLDVAITENFPCDLYFFGGTENRERQSMVPIPPATYRIGSLAPHHTQMQPVYPWLGFLQSDRPQGTFRGICDTGLEPYADVILFMAHRPWTWQYPGDSTFQFHATDGRQVTAHGPLRRGTRTWCLFITHRKEVHNFHHFALGKGSRDVSAFTVWHRRLNDLPFDWLRRLDLASGAVAPAQCPQAVLTHEEYRAKQAGIFPALAAQMGTALQREDYSTLYARWLLNQDREAAAKLAGHVSEHMEGKLALALNGGFLTDAFSAVANRSLGPLAVCYEACVAAGVFSPEQAERLQRIFLFFAYATAEDALFPSHQNYWEPDDPRSIRNWAIAEQYSDLFGTPNFQTDVYYNLALFAAVFIEHPMAQAWMAEATTQLDQQLDVHFHPGGVYKESIGYFAHLFHNMLSMASVLKRHGGRDFYADPRFQAAMGALVDYLGAPRVATVEALVHPDHPRPDGLMRYWPAIGDTGHNCTEARLLAFIVHAAWEVRAQHPALSDRLLAAWNECGRPLWGVHAPMFEYLYVQEMTPAAPPLQLAPRNFVNIGQMLRADGGLPSETSLFFRSGRATHHWGFDHGHFTVTTRGSLLIPDYGYYGSAEPTGGAWVHGSGTWVHNIVTFGPYWNGDTGMECRGAERVISLGDTVDYIVADLSLTNVRKENWRNIHPIVPIEYYRHLLFAHNRYILVWDRIDFSIYDAQLRIPCLSRGVTVDGAQARFTGLDDVDLLVTMVAPQAPVFHEGIVGPQRYLLCEQGCQRDYLWVCQPLGVREQPFHITTAPQHVTIAGVDLHGTAFEDHIIYAKGDFGAQVTIGDQAYRLDGRLALLQCQDGREEIRLLDARTLNLV